MKSYSLDLSILASILGPELDDMIIRRDYTCSCCFLSNDIHINICPIGHLIQTRKNMVPMVISNA